MADSTDVYFFSDAMGYGGAEKSLLNLIAGMDRSRWRPTLVHHAGDGIGPLLAGAEELGVQLWAVPRMPEGRDGGQQALAFARRLHGRRPAVFHAQLTWPRSSKFGLAAAVLARVPAVLATEHAFISSPMTRSISFQMRALNVGIDRYIAVSEHVRRCLIETFGWSDEKIVVIPNGVEPSSYAAAVDPELRARLSDGEKRRVLLALSRLDPPKGLSVLLQAAVQLPDTRVVIAGEGHQREQLTALADQLGITDRVDLLGQRSDVGRLLACCDVYVQPSLNEAFGLGALEAMCASRPVVATDVGGTRELVRAGETGLLVPPGDPNALMQAIRRLLDDPAEAARLVTAAEKTVTSFSLGRMADSVTELYDEVLDSRR